MNYDTYLKSGRLTSGVNRAPCWPDASCCSSFSFAAQLLLLILFYCFIIAVIDFVAGTFLSLSLSLSLAL